MNRITPVTLSFIAAFLCVTALLQASEKPEAVFLSLLKNKRSTVKERLKAFKALKEAGKTPSAQLKRGLSRAWENALQELFKNATSSSVFRKAQELLPELTQAGDRMRGVLNQEGKASKNEIDSVVAQSMKPLSALYGEIRRKRNYVEARSRVLELGEYAAWAGVVRGFPKSLGILVANLAFMRNFVEKKYQSVLEFNNHMRGSFCCNLENGNSNKMTQIMSKWDGAGYRAWGYKLIWWANDDDESNLDVTMPPPSAYRSPQGDCGIVLATVAGKSMMFIQESGHYQINFGCIAAVEAQ